jgi:hypothetical protein
MIQYLRNCLKEKVSSSYRTEDRLSSSTTKKVLVVRFDREIVRGFANLSVYLQPTGVEMISPEGAIAQIPYRQIKSVCFVKDLEGKPVFDERREFLGRPKSAGLWLALRFRDGDKLEGTLANDLLQIEPYGVTFVPPEANGNTQRVFVPREALSEITVLGVVSSPLRKKKPPASIPLEQIQLFADE